MVERWAFLVAVGNPHYAGIGGPSHADADAAALSLALVSAGIPLSKQTLLVGADATKAVVESKARTVAKKLKKGDELIVFLAMRRFGWRGKHSICCWDTLADDPCGTALDLADFFE